MSATHILGVLIAAVAPVELPAEARAVTPVEPESVLEFSLDGAAWSARPPAAVFADPPVLVPGDTASATLHVRNTAPSTGVLTVAATNPTASSTDAAEAFGIAASTDDGAAFARTPLAALEACTPLGDAITLASGASTAITIIVDLDPAVTGDTAQLSSVGFDLTVTLTDAAAGDAAAAARCDDRSQVIPVIPGSPRGPTTAPAPDSTPNDFLAITGGQLVVGLLLIAIVSVVTGTVLTVRRNRETT